MGLISRLKKRPKPSPWLAEPRREPKPPPPPLGRWHSEPTLTHPMDWDQESNHTVPSENLDYT